MPDDIRASRYRVVVAAIAVEGGMALSALVLGWLLKLPPLAHIDWSTRGILLGLAAAVPLLVGLVFVTRRPVGPLAGLEDVVRRSIVPLFRGCTLVDLTIVCALAGLGEELLFRGIVQDGLEDATGRPWLALAAASLLFGAAHPITPLYGVLAGLIGVYLGWLLLATGNLLVPIVTHAVYDLAALVYLLHFDHAPPSLQGAAAGHGDEWSI